RNTHRTMRLWSLHPKYLDARGLVALWRETLLAQAVLLGRVRGYRNHPQLHRFKHHPLPIDAISRYLEVIYQEAISRGYRFDPSKLAPVRTAVRLTVTESQLAHEWLHLLGKLAARDPRLYRRWREVRFPEAQPIFVVCPGYVEPWVRSRGRAKSVPCWSVAVRRGVIGAVTVDIR